MTEITHERCSELLAGHQRGELEPEEASAVERHLAGCEECRSELAGVRALFAPGDFDPLRDDERRRLRAAVAQEARLAPVKVHEFPARRSLWERHAGQIVGAAASIVVVLFAILVVWGGLQGGGDDAGDDAGDGGGQAGAETAEGAPAEGPLPFFASPGEVRPEPEAAQDQNAEEDDSARSLSNFQTRLSYTEKSIRRLGESGPIFRTFMQAYSADDARGLAEEFLNQLASDAPEPGLRDQILKCGPELLGDDPERSLLPAFATGAEFKGEDSLILGFVTSDGTTTELNRYSIWAWPVGADCNEILIGTSGAIKARP
jgi:hypothetical protein